MNAPRERAASRLEQRRERILLAAEGLFLTRGYAGVSVNEIVRRAGGSLATFYNEFGGKELLFAEIIRVRASVMFAPEVGRAMRPDDARAGLIAFATRLLDRILSEDSLALYRILISESARFADLREAVLDDNLPSFFARIGKMLADCGVAEAGGREIAEEFLSLVHGQLVFRAACGGGEALNEERKARHIERAVDAFLRLHPPTAQDQ